MVQNKKQVRIDIVSDVVCPWCIIGYRQLVKAMENTDVSVDIHWHPFELNPDMPSEGENLREHVAAKYGAIPEDSKKARANITKLGADLGFTFNYADDMRMVNTFRAHQLIHWAETQGREHDMKLALFDAFFANRLDLNDINVLADCAAGIGLDRDQAFSILHDGSYAADVRGAEQHWIAQGIDGVPAMVFNKRYLLAGAQGVERYAAILRELAEQQMAG